MEYLLAPEWIIRRSLYLYLVLTTMKLTLDRENDVIMDVWLRVD